MKAPPVRRGVAALTGRTRKSSRHCAHGSIAVVRLSGSKTLQPVNIRGSSSSYPMSWAYRKKLVTASIPFSAPKPSLNISSPKTNPGQLISVSREALSTAPRPTPKSLRKMGGTSWARFIVLVVEARYTSPDFPTALRKCAAFAPCDFLGKPTGAPAAAMVLPNPQLDCAAFPETGYFIIANASDSAQHTTLDDGQGKQFEFDLPPYACQWFPMD